MATKVKIYNDSGEDLTIGCFGENSNATFRRIINSGGRHTANFFPGDRVFVAWDEFLDEFFGSDPVQTLTLTDGDRVKAKIDNSGWDFAQVPTGVPFGNNF